MKIRFTKSCTYDVLNENTGTKYPRKFSSGEIIRADKIKDQGNFVDITSEYLTIYRVPKTLYEFAPGAEQPMVNAKNE